MSDLPLKADIHQRGLHVRLVPSGHQSRRNPSGSSARCLDFVDMEETRPRAEDASRVPRRADPVAECDLAEVFATGFDLPAN
jgi:hypothetical protein